jgi:hypothetical protein
LAVADVEVEAVASRIGDALQEQKVGGPDAFGNRRKARGIGARSVCRCQILDRNHGDMKIVESGGNGLVNVDLHLEDSLDVVYDSHFAL